MQQLHQRTGCPIWTLLLGQLFGHVGKGGGDSRRICLVRREHCPTSHHPASAGSAWWNSSTGAIDTDLQKNFNVIPSYGEGIVGGQIDDTAAWNTKWNAVITKYGSNGNVYFEPANVPYGYNTADWNNIAAGWLQQHSNAPQSRAN